MKCRTETAEFYWDTQGAKTGFLQKSDLVERQGAVSLTIHRAGSDLFEDRRETRSQFIIANWRSGETVKGRRIKSPDV